MQDNKTDNLPRELNENQARDEKAEQEAANQEYKKKTEEMLKSHRPDEILAPTLFFAIVSVSLLFVNALGVVGVLAYYSSHLGTLEITFVSSLLSIIVVLIGAVWYFAINIRKSSTEEGRTCRETPVRKTCAFLLW